LQVESVVLRCICRHIEFPYSLQRCVEDWLEKRGLDVDNYVLIHEDAIVGQRIRAFLILLNNRKVFDIKIECLEIE